MTLLPVNILALRTPVCNIGPLRFGSHLTFNHVLLFGSLVLLLYCLLLLIFKFYFWIKTCFGFLFWLFYWPGTKTSFMEEWAVPLSLASRYYLVQNLAGGVSLSTWEPAIEGYLGLHFNQGSLFLKITGFFLPNYLLTYSSLPSFPSMCKNKIFLIKKEALRLWSVSLIRCDWQLRHTNMILDSEDMWLAHLPLWGPVSDAWGGTLLVVTCLNPRGGREICQT